jgi:hypothetical protein
MEHALVERTVLRKRTRTRRRRMRTRRRRLSHVPSLVGINVAGFMFSIFREFVL